MRLARLMITCCARMRATAGPMIGIWRTAASDSISASTSSRAGSRLFRYCSISGLTITEDPRENFVDVAELAVERKALRDLFRPQHARDFRIGFYGGSKIGFMF